MKQVEKLPYCKYVFTYQSDHSDFRLEQSQVEYETPKSTFVKESNFKKNVLGFLEKERDSYEHVEFGINYFKGPQSRKLMKEIENEVFDQNLFLKVNSLSLKSRFMYLYPGDEAVISDFIRIIDPSLEILTIDLTGNYLNVLSLAPIIKNLNNSHPNLVDIFINFDLNSNGEFGNIKDAQKNEGILAAFAMKNLQKLSLNLVNAKNVEYFFCGLEFQHFVNVNLKLLDLELKNKTFNADYLKRIFSICVGLESFSLDFEKTEVSNMAPFLRELSQSRIQKLRLSIENGRMNITINELMEILCSSQSIISINLNFRGITHSPSDFHNMLDYLPFCKTVAHLRIQIQGCNASNENFEQFSIALQNTKVRLIDFHLDCTNATHKPIASEVGLMLGKSILGLPYLLFPSLRYSVSNKQCFESVHLRDYQKDARRAVYSIVAYNKLVKNLMVYNPTFIYEDLFY